MGVYTPLKPHAGKKTRSSGAPAPRLDIVAKPPLCGERSHEIGKHFRHTIAELTRCPPSGNKVRGVDHRGSFMVTGSTFAFDQVAGGVYCAAIGDDNKPTGEEWAVTFRAEESLLPRQFRTGMKRSRAEEEEEEDSDDAVSDYEDREDVLVEARALVKNPTPASHGCKNKGNQHPSKKNRAAPSAPKKKPRHNASSRRSGEHAQEHHAERDDGDTTETEASHLARTHRRKEGDQVLVPSTSGSSHAGGDPSDDADPSARERSDGETSLGRGKRITSGPYGRAQKSKGTSGRDKLASTPRADKAPRPKQRDTALSDPLNAYNHEFETPAFKGRRDERRATSVTGDSEVARLCARVDDLGVRSVTGSAAPSVIDTGECSKASIQVADRAGIATNANTYSPRLASHYRHHPGFARA